MNNQTTAQRLLRNFRQQGLTRQAANLFGKPTGASPVALMREALTAAGLFRSQPSFFGITLDGQPTHLRIQGQSRPAAPGKLFILPAVKRGETDIAYAA